ncbi:MAG: hypothetical protein RL071_2851, partial [Pseudomonadota bacterium]
MTRGAGRAARRAAWASLLWGLAGLVCAGPAAPAPPGGPAGPGPAAPGPWSVEPLPLVEALRQRPLPAQATPLSAQAAERRLAAALRAAPLPPGAAVQLGCADRQLWVRLQAQDPAAVAAALPALDAALARAVRARPARKGELSLAALDALLSDLDRLDQARGAVGAGPSGGWVGGGAFAVQVDGLPLLRIRLLIGGLGPIDAPGGAAERAAALDGGGPAGLGAALRAAGVGAWERGAAARP